MGFAQQSLVISHVRGRVPCMKAAQSSLVCDTYPTRVRDPGPSKMVAHAASDKNRLPPSRAILLSLPPCEKCCNCFLFVGMLMTSLLAVSLFLESFLRAIFLSSCSSLRRSRKNLTFVLLAENSNS